jgi:CubicO group peptidase (beta-lactamase class C family)
VQDGAVAFLQGFGVRERGRTQPVTPDTLMGVGSATKSFTTTLAATLVDAGRLQWETSVVDLLPGFSLSDPEIAEHLTISDLFSAASGLPRRDLELVFEPDAYTPEGLLSAVASFPLVGPTGERYRYSNQAFTIGGYAAAVADGATPDDLRNGYFLSVQDRVLNPTGMDRSTFELAEVLRSGDYAVPHSTGLDGAPMSVPLQVDSHFTGAVAPAGGLWSSARDMALYLQMQLASGVAADGTRVVSTENLERTWQPGVSVPPAPELPPLVSQSLETYGLGWYVGHYDGLEVVSHSGGTYGFGTEVAFLPEARLGIAVLANDVVCGALVGFAAQYRLLEIVFDQEPAVEAGFASFLAAVKAQRASLASLLRPIDPAALAPFIGRFRNPDLGDVEFRIEKGELLFDAGEVHSRLAPLAALPGLPAQYIIIDPPLHAAPAFFTFQFVENAPRPALTLRGEYGDPPLVYPFARG